MRTYRLPNRSIPLLLSGDTADVVRAEAAALLSFALDHPDVSAQRVADTVFRTRVVRRSRALAMVACREDLLGALQAVRDGARHPLVVQPSAPATARRTAFVFPGQGAQRPGMGRIFYEQSPAYRAEADRIAQAFHSQCELSPLDYLLDDAAPQDDRARVAQPALFTQMAALAAMWRAAGAEPALTLGHSQGEVAAAYVSGMVTLHDAVAVVGARAALADDFDGGEYAMAVAAVSREACEDVLARSSGWAQLSVVNSPSMVGVSGDRATAQQFVDTLAARGAFARMIRVQFPAHTSDIARLDDRFGSAIAGALDNHGFFEGDIACVGSTFGEQISAEVRQGEYWFWNLRNTVRFDKAVACAVRLGADSFVELSGHPALHMAIHENLGAAGAPGHEDEALVVGTSSREATGLDEFARNLADLAVRHLDHRWDRLCEDAEPSPPPQDFPNAPMRQLRLWLPYTTPAPRPALAAARPDAVGHEEGTRANGSAEAERPTARLLEESWVRLTQRAMSRPSSIGFVDHTGRCAQWADALCSAAERHGASARVVGAGAETAGLDMLAVLLPRATDEAPRPSAEEVASFFGDREWWTDAPVQRYCLVTIGGEAVVGDDPPPSLAPAAAAAGFRCVGAERPGVSFHHLDLDSEPLQPRAAAAVVAALHTEGEPELALRGSDVYAKRLVEADAPREAGQRLGHVVVIGGTGKLGMEFCEHFAASGARRVSLVSRSGATSSTERLERIRATGARVDLVACDASDQDAVARLALAFQDAPVDLLIHAAVDYADVELSDVTAEKARQVLDAKALGAAWAVDALPRARDFRVLLCSSLAASIGGRGQIVYAAANRMLDALAARLRSEGLRCSSVQWGQWEAHLDLKAHGLRKLSGAGVRPMPPAQALALGMGESSANFIVAALDLEQARSVLEPYGYGPLLSELAADVPPIPSAAPAPAPAAGGGRGLLVGVFAEVVGETSPSDVNVDAPMVSIGLDSLQALELRRRIKAELGRDVAVADLLGGASVKDLMAKLGDEPAPFLAPSPASAPVSALEPAPALEPVLPEENPADRARRAAELVLPDGLDAERVRAARGDLDAFGMRAMMEVLGPALADASPCSAEKIAARLEFAPRHRWLLQRWLDELVERGRLALGADGYRSAGEDMATAYPDLRSACAVLGYSEGFADFFQSCNERLLGLVQDRVSVQEILFRDGDMLAAEAAYRDNLISSYLNRAASAFVGGEAARLGRGTEPVRILELGAGVGGMTNDIVLGLAGAPVEYFFTDVSEFFLAAARKRFAARPWMRYGLMDINKDLATASRYDIVLGSNVLHNAQDVGRTLRQLRDAINPGGVLVFIETCRSSLQLLTSMKILMSTAPDQPNVGMSDVRAGGRIFLSEEEWTTELVAAGFAPRLELPDPGHPMRPLDQRVFAAERV